jgi:hypothetical protein
VGAPAKTPSPAEQLRTRLELDQSAGLPFDVAWDRAWKRVTWPHDTTRRRHWKRALASTRNSWERAYEGRLDGAFAITAMELVA